MRVCVCVVAPKKVDDNLFIYPSARSTGPNVSFLHREKGARQSALSRRDRERRVDFYLSKEKGNRFSLPALTKKRVAAARIAARYPLEIDRLESAIIIPHVQATSNNTRFR